MGEGEQWGNIFGTDGVRGVANAELTPELAFKLGSLRRLAFYCNKRKETHIHAY